jgi:hypothetical protein
MASTLRFEVTSAAWTEVADGSADVVVQRPLTNAPVMVHVGTTAPALDAPAIVLATAEPTFSAGSLSGADKVYVRAQSTASSVVVVRS